jgi:uncharacterized membrane protein YqjE
VYIVYNYARDLLLLSEYNFLGIIVLIILAIVAGLWHIFNGLKDVIVRHGDLPLIF